MLVTARPQPIRKDDLSPMEPARTVLDDMVDLWLVQTLNHPGPAAEDDDRVHR